VRLLKIIIPSEIVNMIFNIESMSWKLQKKHDGIANDILEKYIQTINASKNVSLIIIVYKRSDIVSASISLVS